MISAKVNLGPLLRVLAAVRRPDLRPVWREARKPVRDDVKAHGKEGRGPDGPWQPRAASTKARDRYGGRPRRLLGRLPNSNSVFIEKRRMRVVSKVAWSGSQREGDTVGHGAKLPARDWAYVSKAALDVVADMTARFLDKLWKRGG